MLHAVLKAIGLKQLSRAYLGLTDTTDPKPTKSGPTWALLIPETQTH